MKKIIAVTMAIITATFLAPIPNVGVLQSDITLLPKVVQAEQQQNYSIILNGNALTFSGVQPSYDSVYDNTFVPARTLLEHMGFQTTWDNSTKTATFKRGNITITAQIGGYTILYKGEGQICGEDSSVVNGTLMLRHKMLSRIPDIYLSQNSGNLNILDMATATFPTPISPGRPEVEDITFAGYVINKVNIGNGIVLCKGDTREVVESLLGKPDRDTLNNEYGIDNGPENHSLSYDDLNAIIRYTNEGLLSDIILKGTEHSFMGYKMGDPYSLEQELRSYESWNPGFGYAWPNISLGNASAFTKIAYQIYGNTDLTNEPKPTSVGLITITFYY